MSKIISVANPKGMIPQGFLGNMFGTDYANIGIILAIIIAVVIYIVLNKTT